MELIVEGYEAGIELAFVAGNRLDAYWRRDERQITGRLFRARVSDIDRTLDGAFLDYGSEPAGFIQGRDLKRLGDKPGKGAKQRSIERFITVGQHLLVQGTREAEDGKGPRMTGRPRLEGRLLVFSPTESRHSVSPRIKGRRRDELLEQLASLRPEGGLTARRLSQWADADELAHEAEELVAFAAELSSRKGQGAALPGFLDLVDAALWQALDWPIERIVVSAAGLAARLRRILARTPNAFEIELVDTDRGIFEFTGIADELAIAASRDVPLGEAGRISIEQTAACVAIDVDGGGMPAIDANLAAAEEIARQCRLRNLGGTIIVDFIDMPTKPQIQKLEESLRRHFRHDPLPVQILPITPIGIGQISRAKRGGNPLRFRQKLCPHCGGQGTVGL